MTSSPHLSYEAPEGLVSLAAIVGTGLDLAAAEATNHPWSGCHQRACRRWHHGRDGAYPGGPESVSPYLGGLYPGGPASCGEGHPGSTASGFATPHRASEGPVAASRRGPFPAYGRGYHIGDSIGQTDQSAVEFPIPSRLQQQRRKQQEVRAVFSDSAGSKHMCLLYSVTGQSCAPLG